MDEPESPPAGPPTAAGVAPHEPTTEHSTEDTRFVVEVLLSLGGSNHSHLQDSSVFNYINNLSPIATMKPPDSVENVQLFKASNLEPVSSIFTSPQVNPQKESNLTIRDGYLSQERPNPNCQMSQIGTSSCIELSGSTTTASENCSINLSVNKALAPNVSPKNASVLPSKWPLHDSEALVNEKKLDADGETGHTVDVEQLKLSSTCSYPNGLNLDSPASRRSVQENEVAKQYSDEMAAGNLNYFITHCGTGSSIVSKSDLSFHTEQPLNWKIRNDNALSTKSLMPVNQGDRESSRGKLYDRSAGCDIQSAAGDIPAYCAGAVESAATNYDPKMLSGGSQSQLVSKDYLFDTLKVASDDTLIDNALSQHQCGTHRRSLFNDTVGDSNMSMHTVSNLCHASTCGDIYLKPVGSSAFALPVIGLHLNAVASISKDTLPYDNEATGDPSNNMALAIDPQLLPEHNCPMKSVVSGSEPVPFSNELDTHVRLDQSTQKTRCSADESGPGSHKKKKRKFQNGDGDSCRRCSCKKSKCLKLYCACFAAKVYCSEFCSCHGCSNTHTQEETVLCTRKQTESRNPLAFAPKVIHTRGSDQEFGDDLNKTPASARHKRGCNCRKSSCVKKYCECFQTGLGCSTSCRCERCKNSFGRREGEGWVSLLTTEKMEQGSQEKSAHVKEEKLKFDKQHVAVQSGYLPSAENVLTTPSTEPCRSAISLPSTWSKPPLSSTECSSQLHNSQSPMKADVLLYPLETYAAEMILGSGSPHIQEGASCCTTNVKIVSPNKKRVSPLRIGTNLSPLRSGRKLILNSIPSFPSLTGHVVSPTKSAFDT
ncbi:hypothetical protein ACP70R_024817 [Stipagrostis hirtigluma subsp. patula]